MNQTSTLTLSDLTASPSATWQAWRTLSDDLVVRMAIDAASRRIATAYAR